MLVGQRGDRTRQVDWNGQSPQLSALFVEDRRAAIANQGTWHAQLVNDQQCRIALANRGQKQEEPALHGILQRGDILGRQLAMWPKQRRIDIGDNQANHAASIAWLGLDSDGWR